MLPLRIITIGKNIQYKSSIIATSMYYNISVISNITIECEQCPGHLKGMVGAKVWTFKDFDTHAQTFLTA